jgi:flagellar assembly protein FliH
VSSVIKAGQNFKVAPRLTTVDLADHGTEAKRILEEARAAARAMIAQARRESIETLQAAQREGYAEGHAQGHAAGLEAGQGLALSQAKERFERELGALCEALEKLLAELEAGKRDLLIAARHDVLDFAVALARRIVKRVGQLDRGAAADNLEEALAIVAGWTDVTVRVSPADAESLRRFADDLVARVAASRRLTLVEDSSIAPGGCLVSTAETRIDARIESQIEDIARLLLGDLTRHGPV